MSTVANNDATAKNSAHPDDGRPTIPTTPNKVPTNGPASGVDERVKDVGQAARLLGQPALGASAGAVVVFAFFAIYTAQFGKIAGIANWLDPASTIGISSLAVALLMIGGEFDLSAGVMIGSSSMVTGLLATQLNLNIWLAMAGGLLYAILVGIFNGFMVVRTKLPSFIVTLGTFFILQGVDQGVVRKVTNTVRIDDLDKTSGYRSANRVFGSTFTLFGTRFQVSILWWIVLTVIAAWILARTRSGNWITSVGGDASAARGMGIPVARVKISLFVLTAASGWLVGTMTALRLTSVTSSQGVGQELVFIVAAVVGGCLLTGGHGSVVGASVGAVIFGMVELGIPYAGWNSDWFFAFLGTMLLFAVLVNNIIRQRFQEASS